mmetsp:Transcript_25775/g.33784  ORF Transcript_25775/g.33784 Transcript_25775/m.33784 type:complete len:95 (-) Transcript_25775:1068-1352(-)
MVMIRKCFGKHAIIVCFHTLSWDLWSLRTSPQQQKHTHTSIHTFALALDIFTENCYLQDDFSLVVSESLSFGKTLCDSGSYCKNKACVKYYGNF